MNYLTCLDSDESNLWIFNTEIAPPLLYYSYIPIAILLLIIGILIFLKNKKSTINIIFFLISLNFVLIILNEIIQWIAIPLNVINFSWQMVILLESFLYILYIYLVYVFVNNKDFEFKHKLILFLLFLPIIIFLPTHLNISNMDVYECNGKYGILIFYNYFLQFLSIVTITFIYIRKNKSLINNDLNKKRIKSLTMGTLFFLVAYSLLAFYSDITLFYEINLFGPLAKLIFLLFLAYLIIKFNTFKIKILTPQVLVWLLIFLNFSILFIQEISYIKIIVSITILISIIIGWVLIVSVKKIEKQRIELDIANDQQTNLLHFITHQIKAYLTKSRNIYSALLESDYVKVDPETKKYVEIGFESDTKGVETVQNILHASDLKKGVIEFQKIEFDMLKLLKNTVENLKQNAEMKGLKIIEHYQEDNFIFSGDELRIGEVFKNLIDNSIRYTQEGNITISLSKHKNIKNNNVTKIIGKNKNPNLNYIRFIIKDTGIGLDEHDKKVLFRQGGKGKDSSAYNIDSTGYGLFIVKSIIVEHDGKISVQSAGRDRGTTFTIDFPA
jgi:signal transduction histidine kinase